MDNKISARHLSSFMLGMLAITWAPIPFWASANFRMVYVLRSLGIEWEWLGWWIIIGVLLIYGSMYPCRKCRMVGLGASAIGWFGFLSMYVRDWQYSPSTMSMLVYGCMSVITLISDSRRKPRVAAN